MTDPTNPNTTSTALQAPELPVDWEERTAAYDRQFAAAVDGLVAAIRCDVTDGAETISHLLATAAANLGGMHALTAGRPGSWEADHVDRFLASTVGPGGEYLLEYRTAPIEVVECVDRAMADLGIDGLYNDSRDLIDLAEIDVAEVEDHDAYDAAVVRADQAALLIEELRQRDYAAYKAAFERQVQEAAAELRRTRYLAESVPVSVRWVEWNDQTRATADQEAWGTVEQELWEAAQVKTPPPGFTEPLDEFPGTRSGEILRATGRMPHQRIPELAHYGQPSTQSAGPDVDAGRADGGEPA